MLILLENARLLTANQVTREKSPSLPHFQKQSAKHQVSDVSFLPNIAQVLVCLPFQNYNFSLASVPNSALI